MNRIVFVFEDRNYDGDSIWKAITVITNNN